MKQLITLTIDVEKINKAKLYKGKKGTYLTMTYYYDSEKDKFENNGMIVEQQSKEEKDKGIKSTILGNAKIVWSEEQDRKMYLDNKKAKVSTNTIDDTDLPF